MQGADLNGRRINVELSKRTKPREPTPGTTIMMQADIWERRDLLLPADPMVIASHTPDRRVARLRGIDIVIMRREDTDTIVTVLAQNHPTAGDADPDKAIPDHLADDMYTSPTTT